ncbi:MAG: ABC transporter permease [Clostridia bacterium]|nr:ABC transporter permease [Clostridia bacterium]
MRAIRYGLKSMMRRWRQTLAFFLISFVIGSALLFGGLIRECCAVFQARNEDPYMNYYRLLLDRKNDGLSEGYDDADFMSAPAWQYTRKFHEYFQNIVDYTVVLYRGPIKGNITPVLREVMKNYGELSVMGVMQCTDLDEFVRGELSIVEGRALTRQDYENKHMVCLISDQLAAVNDLHVGDPVEINLDGNETTPDSPLTVAGIYRDNAQRNEGMVDRSYNLQANRIYIPCSVAEEIPFVRCYNYQILLDDDVHIDEIERIANAYNMGRGYPLLFMKVADIYASENSGLHALSAAVEITQIVWIGVALAVVFLFLFSAVTSRRREMGIRLALGEKGGDIVLSVAAEFLLSAAGAATVVSLIGGFIGTDVAVDMLQSAMRGVSSEALRNTTSDAISVLIHEEMAVHALISTESIYRCIGQMWIWLLSVVGCGVMGAFVRMAGKKPMHLLKKDGES